MRPAMNLLFVAILLAGCTLRAPGQAPAADQPPTLKTTARAVVVDVVVTKGNDEPVGGLHKPDFQVLEDGKPQRVDSFEEHTSRTLSAESAPLPPMPPNVYTNAPPVPSSDAVNVLLLDTLNTSKQDQGYARQQILNFLKFMAPGTRAAIFLLGSKLRYVQGFTADSALLAAALNGKRNVSAEKDAASRSRDDDADDAEHIQTMITMNNGHSTAGVEAVAASQRDSADFQFGDRIAMTMDALDYLARYLGGVPGRKNLIWFASSFPVTVFPSASEREAMSHLRGYADRAKTTAYLLTASKVAVYPVNAQGMMNDHVMEADSDGPRRVGGMSAYSAEAAARADTIDSMEHLASDTGGKAFYNVNDLRAAVQHAINDGSHYYTLVYSPANTKTDGKFHRIQVKLNEGKYKLSYRRGYNTDDRLAAETKPDEDPLRHLILRGMPSETEILYAARVVPATIQPAPGAKPAGLNPQLTGPRTRYNIDFMIPWTYVTFTGAGDLHTGKLQLGLMAYDRDGNAVNWFGAMQSMSLSPKAYTALQKSGIPAHLEIDLPDKDVVLETGVFDWATGKAGTLEIPLHPGAAPSTAPSQAAAKKN